MGGASKFLMLLSTPFPLLHHRAAALRISRRIPLAASSFSSAAGAGRRIIPSASRPRRPGFSLRAASESVHSQAAGAYGEPSLGSLPVSRASHPWPEWARLVDHLVAVGYSERRSSVAVDDDDSFAVYEDLPAEFIRAAEACLSFARDRTDVLRLLSWNNIEAVVENGSPFLFKNGVHSARRMRLFLSGDENNVLESERAQTVDVMRYVLSYAYNPLAISDENSHESRELVDTSVRNLLVELVNVSGAVRESKLQEPTQWRSTFRNEQVRGLPGQNIEMKRGDWICPKCTFMNFARNVRCLECDEGRPKRQLTGAEWECPQCDFFNYGRNMSCLRCDCKRPGEAPVATAVPGVGTGYNGNTRVDKILSGANTDRSEIERRLAANDEKAERWFSKVSQLDDSSDTSSAVADEDFPEIMPMRKGVNRFVVSTRKTPLERRLANSQSGGLGRSGLSKTSDSSISQSLDRILGRTSSETNQQPATGEINTGSGSRFSSPEYRQSIANQRGDTDYVPFVPLPADMFSKSKKSNNDVLPSQEKEDSASKKASELSDSLSKSSGSTTLNGNEEESSDASARWSKNVAELDNVTDLASAIPDEDFPEIMPMRKGENRFVVSKKKDRSLTSPQYKRRLAMEQANSSNFVPFVPFPPDYFAKKDKQPEAATPSSEAAPPCKETAAESSALPEKAQGMPPKMEDLKAAFPSVGSLGKMSQQPGSVTYSKSHNAQVSGNNCNEESNIGTAYSAPFPNSAQLPSKNSKESWNSGISRTSSASDGPNGTGSSTHQGHNSQNSRENWNQGFSGKSLEGSAVKEPDPLDMSEEAKAERWFRRVAQIKDISELSQIPDEDFPEIMPMRKGVNRFVVSKRKTPLERRLTSPQYRKNLPIVSSEPKEDTS